jgi:peptidoglycan/LPS O-acetylase OafA/YrhL
MKWQTLIGINLDVLYAPVAVFTLVMLLRDSAAAVRKPLEFLGGHSMNIWFLHSIFFTPVLRPFLERFAFLPRNPILVILWVVLLCLPVSIIINFLFRQQEKIFTRLRSKHPAASGSC